MTADGYTRLINAACALGWLFVMLPSIVYLLTGWRARRERLFGYFAPEALKIYFQQYFPSVNVASDTNAQLTARFKDHYARHYGIRHYVWPLILLGAVAGLVAWGTAATLRVWVRAAPEKSFALDPIVVSALMGAFVWVLADQLSRFRSFDFTEDDVNHCVFRFLMAVPFGYCLAALVKPEVGISLAFLIGTFPTGTIFTIARRLGSRNLGLGEQEGPGPSELEQLQSIGRSNSERFRDEGVTTIVELAWADPVDLTIRTNTEFSYVVDCMSQALLWVYFGAKVKDLYKYSLRGAWEVSYLVENLSSPDTQIRESAQSALRAAAGELSMDQSALYFTLKEISDDPYAKLLMKLWH